MRLPGNKKKVKSKFVFYIFIFFIVVLLAITGFYGNKAYNYFFFKKRIFTLKKVNITGDGITYREKIDILKLSGLYKGENLLKIDLARVSSLIASLRWIKNVTVYRSFPHTVTIYLIKRKIFGILENGKNMYYISPSGFVIGKVNSKDGYNYPVVTGMIDKDPSSYYTDMNSALNFLNISNSSVISGDIGEIHMEKDGGIVVYTKEGVMINFGKKGYRNKLEVLKKLFNEISKIHLKYNQYINLEYNGEAVVAVNKGSRVVPADYKNKTVSANAFK